MIAFMSSRPSLAIATPFDGSDGSDFYDIRTGLANGIISIYDSGSVMGNDNDQVLVSGWNGRDDIRMMLSQITVRNWITSTNAIINYGGIEQVALGGGVGSDNYWVDFGNNGVRRTYVNDGTSNGGDIDTLTVSGSPDRDYIDKRDNTEKWWLRNNSPENHKNNPPAPLRDVYQSGIEILTVKGGLEGDYLKDPGSDTTILERRVTTLSSSTAPPAAASLWTVATARILASWTRATSPARWQSRTPAPPVPTASPYRAPPEPTRSPRPRRASSWTGQP